MALTYDQIATVTIPSDTSFIEFSSITQSFTDLIVVLQGRTSRTATADEAVGLRFNGDSSTNYSVTYFLSGGASIVSARAANISYLEFARMNPSFNSNTSPSISVAQIFSYSSNSIFKTTLGSWNSPAEAYPVGRYVALWRNVSPITSIRVIPAIGPNFVAGTNISIYGIKAA